MLQQLTPQEEEAMKAVWQVGEGNVKMFREAIPEPMPQYTTLAATIKNLEKKGYLSSRLIGNVYLYKPLISEAGYARKFMNGFVRNYFDNSYKDLVGLFVKQKKLNAADLQELIDMIESEKRS